MEANKEEVTDEDQVEWYSRRLDAGLSSLQNANYVLAWVCMEDDGVSYLSSTLKQEKQEGGGDELTCQARVHAQTMLKRKGQAFSHVISVLEGESSIPFARCGILSDCRIPQ